jgi:hypothetical protein
MGRNERNRHTGLLRFTRKPGMAAFSFRKDNHSACAGWQGFGAEPTNKLLQKLLTLHCLPLQVSSLDSVTFWMDHKFVIRVYAALFLCL